MSTERRPAAFLFSGRYGWCHYCDYLGLELIRWFRFGVVVVFGSVIWNKKHEKNGLEAEQWTPFWEGKTAYINHDFWLQNVSFRRCRWKLLEDGTCASIPLKLPLENWWAGTWKTGCFPWTRREPEPGNPSNLQLLLPQVRGERELLYTW